MPAAGAGAAAAPPSAKAVRPCRIRVLSKMTQSPGASLAVIIASGLAASSDKAR